jgi:starvation-inducible DNA-binding protein
MSTSRTDHPTVRSSLDPAAQDAVAARLQPLLIDLLDLALTGKQLHWTVVGPQFRALHEQLDEVVAQYRTWSDQVAERMTSIGVTPDGRVQRIAGDSPADPAPEGWVEASEVVRELASRIEAVARRTRTALDGLGDHDLVSEGLVTEILEGLEMQLWMVSAQEA